ncbi:FecR domain-containing protein [Rugamonas sp.]|uniref:FecR family protein n=1 Tax=Rugamonas sp. TaxID=1926287 RepID=UPI0025DE5DE2|nr:FecR domain-containing protein [Rugamonas sp.]
MSAAAETEEQAARWLARRDGEDWSDDDQALLHAWIAASLANRVAWLRLESCWRRADRLGSTHAPGRASVPPRRLPRFSPWRAAAGVLLAAALFAAMNAPQPARTYHTARGESRPVTLADGSTIVLNTDTRLRADVDGRARHVVLDSGEAYFEVAHDAAHPFVIDAGRSRVTVLGTRFSVRRDGDRVAVAVVDGRVKVESLPSASPAAPAAAVAYAVLVKNEMASAESGRLTVSVGRPDEVARQLAWRQGKLFLDGMSLAQAAQEFNRYNRVQLVVDDAAAALPLGGSFNVDNVAGFARLLQQGFGLKVEATADQIHVRR